MLFYAPDILNENRLPEAEARHCLNVLRKRTGDIIKVTDGKGNSYEAEIIEANPKRCFLKILKSEHQQSRSGSRIEIALAPTKNMERNEWFAEKATEIGIDKISFLHSQYSERKEIKIERVEKVLVAAMKQSLKFTLPEHQKMTEFNRFVNQEFIGQKFIAHCRPGEKPLLSQIYQKNKNVLILIGPEGDFSEEEVRLAEEKGFISVSLGESRLRTETAAFVACHTIHIANQLK